MARGDGQQTTTVWMVEKAERGADSEMLTSDLGLNRGAPGDIARKNMVLRESTHEHNIERRVEDAYYRAGT